MVLLCSTTALLCSARLGSALICSTLVRLCSALLGQAAQPGRPAQPEGSPGEGGGWGQNPPTICQAHCARHMGLGTLGEGEAPPMEWVTLPRAPLPPDGSPPSPLWVVGVGFPLPPSELWGSPPPCGLWGLYTCNLAPLRSAGPALLRSARALLPLIGRGNTWVSSASIPSPAWPGPA